MPRPNETKYSELRNSIEARRVLTPLATYIDGDHWLINGVSCLQVMVELDKTVLDVEGRWAIPTTPYSEEKGHDPPSRAHPERHDGVVADFPHFRS